MFNIFFLRFFERILNTDLHCFSFSGQKSGPDTLSFLAGVWPCHLPAGCSVLSHWYLNSYILTTRRGMASRQSLFFFRTNSPRRIPLDCLTLKVNYDASKRRRQFTRHGITSQKTIRFIFFASLLRTVVRKLQERILSGRIRQGWKGDGSGWAYEMWMVLV